MRREEARGKFKLLRDILDSEEGEVCSAPKKCQLAPNVIILAPGSQEGELFIDNLLVRTYIIDEMIWWTGLAPWEFEFSFPGSLISTGKSTYRL